MRGAGCLEGQHRDVLRLRERHGDFVHPGVMLLCGRGTQREGLARRWAV